MLSNAGCTRSNPQSLNICKHLCSTLLIGRPNNNGKEVVYMLFTVCEKNWNIRQVTNLHYNVSEFIAVFSMFLKWKKNGSSRKPLSRTNSAREGRSRVLFVYSIHESRIVETFHPDPGSPIQDTGTATLRQLSLCLCERQDSPICSLPFLAMILILIYDSEEHHVNQTRGYPGNLS